MASDRILGLVLFGLALAYIVSATQIQTSFLFDPVGPKTVPIVIGALMALCAVIIFARPDEEPDWPEARTFLRLGAATGVLVAYALLLKPAGFLVPTAIVAGILAYQITPRPVWAVVTGLGLSVGLFVMFRHGLGLGLQPWPKGLFG